MGFVSKFEIYSTYQSRRKNCTLLNYDCSSAAMLVDAENMQLMKWRPVDYHFFYDQLFCTFEGKFF
ncbi:hypothetical protein T03_9864 [Trichinella britovi]|uniref:Uncharacterized protein n=1 Tax=Trichinella britovi TaxID=45882 RepID=A0A0V1CZW6_TRIBR|nr:hypothetical protein T03_9864 [Trichinella britovi]